MIWATVSSRSCFCWLYRASPSLTAKNRINLISVLTMCRVFSCVVGRGCLLWAVRSLGKTLLVFALLHSVLPRPSVPVTPGVSWLPTFLFQSPIKKTTSFFGISFNRPCRSSWNHSLQLLQRYWLGHRLGSLWYWMVCLGDEQRSFCHFWDCIHCP